VLPGSAFVISLPERIMKDLVYDTVQQEAIVGKPLRGTEKTRERTTLLVVKVVRYKKPLRGTEKTIERTTLLVVRVVRYKIERSLWNGRKTKTEPAERRKEAQYKEIKMYFFKIKSALVF
jgi:hypothetical protein